MYCIEYLHSYPLILYQSNLVVIFFWGTLFRSKTAHFKISKSLISYSKNISRLYHVEFENDCQVTQIFECTACFIFVLQNDKMCYPSCKQKGYRENSYNKSEKNISNETLQFRNMQDTNTLWLLVIKFVFNQHFIYSVMIFHKITSSHIILKLEKITCNLYQYFKPGIINLANTKHFS